MPNLDELVERRKAIADHAALHEQVPQSPWSPDNPAMKDALKEGATLLSERPVAFVTDDSIVLVGADAVTVATRCTEPWESSLPEHYQKVIHARLACAKIELRETKGVQWVEMSSQRWNGCNFALEQMGILTRTSEGS